MGGHNSPHVSEDLQNISLSSNLSSNPDSVINLQSISNDNIEIPQLDGNASFSSNSSLASSSQLDASIVSENEHLKCSAVNEISVIVGNRPAKSVTNGQVNSYRFLKTLRRDNKAVQGLSLPVLSNYNMRSIWAKLDSYAEDFIERTVGLSFLTEIWQKSTNIKHQNKLEEMFEMKGILYISTPRPGLRRGGGVALAADPSKFTLSKVNVPNPHQLEVSWGLLKPRQVTGPISKIICCAFYSPPNSKKKTKLIEHMSSVLQDLLLDHPGAAVIISGDRNDLSIERLLSVDPNLRQIVKHFTHGTKILDVILTNIGMFYNEPIIVDPVPVDNPANGVPSDHRGVIVNPIVDASHPPHRSKSTKIFRPMPDSLINKFGEEMCNMSWDSLSSELSSTQMTDIFQSSMSIMIDNHFPLKSITITESDQPWITQELKRLKRVRSQEFCRNGRSSRYFQLKNEFEVKQVDAVKKYTDKIIDEVRNGSKLSCYKALRKLGVRAGDIKDDIFTLPEHIENNLSEQESAEKIPDYFSNISS